MLGLLRSLLARQLSPRILRILLPHRPVFYGHLVSNDSNHPIREFYNFPSVYEFEAMIEFTLEAGYRFVSLETYLRSRSRGECLLTFDDGFREVRYVIHPILSRRNIPYCAFVCGFESIHGPCKIRNLNTQGPEFLSLDDVKYLREEGAHIGFHGNRHDPITSNWTSADILDLVRPPTAVSALLSRPWAFAYPFRAPQNFEEVDALIRSEGFEYLFGTEYWDSSMYHFGRVSIDAPSGNCQAENTALQGLRHLALSRTNIRRMLVERNRSSRQSRER